MESLYSNFAVHNNYLLIYANPKSALWLPILLALALLCGAMLNRFKKKHQLRKLGTAEYVFLV